VIQPAADFNRSQPQRPLASWYTQGRSDGLGDRLLMADNTGTAALELLRFRPALAATYGFESALRERVERLDRFRHPAFPQVHAVEYLEEGDGLALVSTYTAGKRVADLLPPPSDWPHRPYAPRAEAHPAFATWLIRQITSAVADLQAQGHEIAHGALTADRIVLTPDRRVVVIEHVLGSALASLELSPDSLWAQVGVVSETSFGVPLLDPRSDVVQIGLVSLAVLLGRRIAPAEYPARLPQLLDEFWDVAGRRSHGLADPLRMWLEQALRTDGRGFRTAKDARGGLGELSDPGVAPTPAEPAPRKAAAAIAPPAPPPAPRVEPIATTQILGLRDIAPARPTTPEPAEAVPAAAAVIPEEKAQDPLDAYRAIEERLRQPDAAVDEAAPRRGRLAAKLAIVFAAVAAVEAAALGAVLMRGAPVAGSATVPVQVASADGDVVLIDGLDAGTGRLELRPSADGHTISVIHRAPPAAPAARVPARPAKKLRVADVAQLAAIAEAASRQQSGGLRLVSPVELQVFEGDRVLGTSADGPVVTSAGTHELEFVNAAVGYRTRQMVHIKAGQIVSLSLTPPSGRVSVNAVPWARVWIDGRALGETPLANVSVAAGEHEIVFRHPQLGEHREKAVVKSGVLTRVSATLGR